MELPVYIPLFKLYLMRYHTIGLVKNNGKFKSMLNSFGDIRTTKRRHIVSIFTIMFASLSIIPKLY